MTDSYTLFTKMGSLLLILFSNANQHCLLLSSNRTLEFMCKYMKKIQLVESQLSMGSIPGFQKGADVASRLFVYGVISEHSCTICHLTSLKYTNNSCHSLKNKSLRW